MIDDAPTTVLLTMTGPDRPGLTTRLMAAVGDEVDVLDVEQADIRGRLTLGVLLGADPDAPGTRLALDAAAAALARVAAELGLSTTVTPAAARTPTHEGRLAVTLIGSPIRASALSAVTGAIAERGANIDRIVRTASYPVTALELTVSGARPEVLRADLAAVATRSGVDVAVQRADLRGRGTHLVVLDVDSTLIQGEVIELIAAHAGREAQVRRITEAAMRGELDFASSLVERVAQLEGLPESVLAEVQASVRLTPGARTLCRTLKRLGYRIALVSGGFSQVVEPLAAELGIDRTRANRLEIVDGRLTGRVSGPIVDRAGKADALEEFAAAYGIPLDRTVAVGDGANDLDMLARAGLGIAFNAKPVVREQADTGLTVPYLDSVLYLLGITRDEVERADRAAGTPTPAPPVDR